MTDERDGLRIAVCWKWVAPDSDERRAGVSAADEAALETALVIATAVGQADVTVVALGPSAADRVLRDALAAGAHRAVRVDGSTDLSSQLVAGSLAAALGDADVIVCGDYSPDRGSGSVPAFVAAELGITQALGLIDVVVDALPTPDGDVVLRALRRLDGGRREQLVVTTPAVISVEGSVATLRRASLPAELAAKQAVIDVIAGPVGSDQHAESIRPYRPRPRVVPPPAGEAALDRIRSITDAGAAVSHGETVVLDPPEAAARIVAALREWGYLADPT